MDMKSPNGAKNQKKIQNKNNELIKIIRNTKVDTSYCYEKEKFLDEKIGYLAANCDQVLDFGKSSRHRFGLFKNKQIETADMNEFEGYPDYLCDICDVSTFPNKKYDAIICNAVIEHVYDPSSAVKNMHGALKEGGFCLSYAPFIFYYHAPSNLKFQDYFRFSRDGLAILFKDFNEVTLYSVRGRSSSGANFILPLWKSMVEKHFPIMGKVVDQVLGGKFDPLQVSGYFVWAVK